MGLGLSLRMSRSLSLRQRMEMNLEQRLFVEPQIKIEQTLYFKRESKLTKLYRKALKRGMVKLYKKHGLEFEYALISAKEIPAELNLSGQLAFSHCLFKRFEALLYGERHALSSGSWLLFVVPDIFPDLPEEYIEYAAVHERGEQATLGNHNLASKLEFAIAKREKRLNAYINWLEEHYPAKFADVFSYQRHLDLPESDKFQRLLELSFASGEAEKIRRLIETFEWPYRLLQKLTFYNRQNEKVIEIAIQALRAAEEIIASASDRPLKEIIGFMREEITRLLRQIDKNGLRRYISFPRLEAIWKESRINADRKFIEMLNIRRASQNYQNYLQELFEAGISDSLPDDGVLSLSFKEALKSL